MDNKYTYLRIIKFIVIILCAMGIVGRLNVSDEYIDKYMAVVNIISFLIAVNLLMYDCYYKIRKKYSEIKDNIIKKTRMFNWVMLIYILIFIFNIIFISAICYFYLKFSSNTSVLNDILGILSLGFAISTDFLSEFVINIVVYIFNK